MAAPVTIALDAMGGDHGPNVVVAGAAIALVRHPDTRFLLSHLSERRQARGALLVHDLLSLDVEPPGAPLPQPPETLRAARQVSA